jgi:tetratricopeptide (TPR) repeat protein
LILAFSLVVLPALAHAQAQCGTVLQDYQVALRAYQDGLFDPALIGFDRYLRDCPQGEQALPAHYLIAEMLFKQNRCAEALTHAQEVIRHTPVVELRPQALLLALQCALQLDRLAVAQTYVQQVLDSQAPGEVKTAALYWAGEIALRQQHYDAARRFYQQVMQSQQASAYALPARYALAWLARQQGDAAAALTAFTTFLQLAPHHELAPQARFARADLLREVGRLEEAAVAFRQLAEEAPSGTRDEALFWWAETAYQLGRYGEAASAYQRLLTTYPQSTRVAESLYGLGWAAVRQRQCAAAVQPWEQLLQRQPAFPQALEVRYELGVCYLQLQHDATARAHLQQVLATEAAATYHQDALLKLAALAYRAQDYAQAVQYYTRALASAKEEEAFRLHYLLGESYAALGEDTQAMAHWQHVLKGSSTLPFYAQTLYRLGSAYVSQQAWPQAIAILQRLWTAFPEFPQRLQVAQALAQAYRSAQQCQEALPLYETLVKTAEQVADQQALLKGHVACLFQLERYAEVVKRVAPRLRHERRDALDASLLYTLGQAYMQLRQFREALEPFTRLQQHFPDSPLVTAMAPRFAFALEQENRRAEALAVWQAYLQHGPIADETEQQRLQLHVGHLALQLEQWDVALAFLAPARGALVPAMAAESLFWSGEVYLQRQQWELAQQVYQELLDRYRAESHWTALAHLRLGTLYEKQQEWEQALQAYQASLATTTDAEVAANARRRIAAIAAGRVAPHKAPAAPSASEG